LSWPIRGKNGISFQLPTIFQLFVLNRSRSGGDHAKDSVKMAHEVLPARSAPRFLLLIDPMSTNQAPSSHTPLGHLAQLAKDWQMASRDALLNLSEPLGAVIQETEEGPTAVLVVHPSTRVEIHQIGEKSPSSIRETPAHHLLLLATRGVMREELKQLLDTIQGATQANDNGASACLALNAKLSQLAEKHDYQGQIDAISDASDAAAANGSFIGRCLHKNIADGHAHYMVTGVIGDKVRLEHLDAVDGYSVPEWGQSAWADKAEVEMFVHIQNARKKMMRNQR
jgi:hypothetical protein